MTRYLLRRVIEGAITLALVIVAVFILGRAVGNPADILLPTTATPQERAHLTAELGLDRPLVVQFGDYMVHLLRGDFGTSLYNGIPVNTLIGQRLLNSIELTTAATLLGVLIAMPFGVLAATHKDSVWDGVARVFALAGQAAPPFWLGLVMVFLFAVRLGVLPTAGAGTIQQLVLPAATLGWFVAAGILRLLRASLIETLSSDYVSFATSLGLPRWRVVWLWAVPNALTSVLTFIGFMYGVLIAGAVVVEVVFVWPGLGQLAYQAIQMRDVQVLQGVVLVWSVLVIGVSLLVDISYALIDPRLRVALRPGDRTS